MQSVEETKVILKSLVASYADPSFIKIDSILCNDVLGCAFELSSMSIRMDEGALTRSAKCRQVSGTKKRLQSVIKWVFFYCRTMPLELVSKKEDL